MTMNLKEGFRRWRRYQQLVRELSSYSHHELTELGTAPADIGRLAETAATQENSAGNDDGAQNIVRGRFAFGLNAASSQPTS
jgi:uncharacterized protein YjiS (DUF1127 family)